jgi:uncharacterized protein (TIRG00374 family)
LAKESPVPAALIPSQDAASPPPAHRSIFWTGSGLILGFFLLFLSFRGVDWPAFWSTFQTGRYAFLLLTLPLLSGSFFLRSIRWGVFIRAEKKIPVRIIFWANMAGYLGNTILPFRAGELVRSAFLGGESGLGTSFILATALAERFFDVIALVLIGSIALLGQAEISASLGGGLLLMTAGGILGLAAFFAAPYCEEPVLGFLERLPGKIPLVLFVRKQTARFLSGVRSLHDVQRLAGFVFLTAVIWLMDAFSATIGVQIIHQTLTIRQALVLLAALGLSSAIPSTPGYVGPYQFAAVAVLVPFGFSQAEALAYILISQVFLLLTVGFWGVIGVWRLHSRSREPTFHS